MAEITGRLIMNVLPNGTVTTAFVPNMGGENMNPIVAQNLGYAEDALVKTFGQTPARAAWIRADLEREGTVRSVICIDVELAATLCVPCEPVANHQSCDTGFLTRWLGDIFF